MSSTGLNNSNSDNIAIWTSTLTILFVLFSLYLIYIGIKLFLIKKAKEKSLKRYNKWLNKKWKQFPVKYKIVKVQPL